MREHRLITASVKVKKTFKDLSFKDNQASLKMKNGYTVVVRTGKGTATTVGSPYEFEVIPMNSIISDDIIGYCSEDDITQLLHDVQALPKIK